MTTFEGVIYRLADNWISILNPCDFQERPIKYLEIGTFYGANLISVINMYGQHKDSIHYCIDPWIDYDGYPEYKGEQDKIYNMFLKNIEPYKNKVVIKRGYSHEQILTIQDNYLDIVYIDGNRQPEYVLEDAVLSFRKLKKFGYMIFDDYGWGGPDLTQRGIDAFLHGYKSRIKVLGLINSQVFIQRIT